MLYSKANSPRCTMTSVCLLGVVVLAVISPVVSQGDFCNGRYCLKDQAKCDPINRTCVCNNPPYTHGPRGYLGCYVKNQVRTEVFNDPTLSTFSEEDVRFQFPCRYLLTNVKQELKNRFSKVIGSCEFQVHAFQGRSLGKLFVEGIEVAIKLKYNNLTKQSSSIVWGTKGNVQRNGTDNAFLTDPISYSNDNIYYADAANNIYVRWFFNPDTQQYVFEALACGLRATFVPYDVSTGISSPYVPGITVAINCAHHPKWQTSDQTMGLDPNHNVSTVLAQYPGLNAQQAFLVRAFTRVVSQTQPNASPLCSAVAGSLSACNNTERITALNTCGFVFDVPKFVKCVAGTSPNSNPVIDLFNSCVKKICNNESVCSHVESLVPPGSCRTFGGAGWNSLYAAVCP